MSSGLPITWPADGLIPAVIQDATSHDVLMVGFMNDEALARTRETGVVHFWSRSRQALWKKGETSGHMQVVREIFVNCEHNSLLIEVDQEGAVCHDGYPTCYYRRLEADNGLTIVRDRWFDPLDVYGGDGGIRATMTRWWGAYEYLRDHDLAAESGTSRRLHDRATSLVPRIRDELRELAGVFDGTHVHSSQHEDALLEASQVCYWIVCELVRQDVAFSDVRPDRAVDIEMGSNPSPATLASLLSEKAGKVNDPLTPEDGHSILNLVANAVASIGIKPVTIFRHDLKDLRSRGYLAPYFAE